MIRVETFRVGVRELGANKLRTALTTLGIVFGVAAVIAMTSIAAGAREEALRQVESLGTRSVRVRAKALAGQQLAVARQRGVRGLEPSDVHSLSRLPGVVAGAALVVREVPVRRGDRAAEARVVGTTADLAVAAPRPLAEGRFLNAEDEASRAQVAVLGARVAQELMPFRSPLGESIQVGGLRFRVVGVLADPRHGGGGEALPGAADPAGDVHVPLSTALLRLPSAEDASPVAEVALRVAEGGSVREVAALVRDRLLRRHQGVEDFEVIVPEELLRQSQRSQRIFNIVMGAIASISLLVGGIGIMNVMLVTVVQRTQEIGIRRAVGARRGDIRDQFLVEALIISALGGACGVALGTGLASGIASFAGWTTIVSPGAVALALVVAGATGVAFGLVPAVKAARLDPIECLRHE